MFSLIVNSDTWLASLAATLKIKLTIEQGRAVQLIVSECDENGITDARQVAYILGTAYHECRFKSIKEIRAKPGTAVWRMQNAYWNTGYYGRGFCQLTWRKNYQKFSTIIGIDLVKNPDEVLRPDVGAKILVIGMRDGLFSGVGLGRYFPSPPAEPNWLSARKIVNGMFQADHVATAAQKIFPLLVESPA